jgi:DNA-binding NarL/FixJ family response regulator
LEFLQQWSGFKNNARAKVLIFTNMENSPEVAEAYKLGAHRCIIKSWTAPHNLARVVADSLQSGSLSARANKATSSKKKAPAK